MNGPRVEVLPCVSMPADPRDDFSIFGDSEHMFFNLKDPFAMIREEVEAALRRQVADTQVLAFRCFDEPKWLTLARKIEGDDSKVTVGHFAVCFRSYVTVLASHGEEQLDATITLLFRDIDRPGEERMSLSMDLFADALRAFDDEVLQRRFMEFRYADDA